MWEENPMLTPRKLHMKAVDVEAGLYRVSFADIKPAKDFDEFEFAFFNPRILDNSKKEMYGFSKEEIDSLKESIRSKGLMENLNINANNGECGLLDGHRRHEAISQLIKENAPCFDNHTNQWVPAKDLYNEVIVKVFNNLSPADCFSRAFDSDSNKVSFGENASIRFVDYCINFRMTEKKIVEMCGKTISWLRYISKLLSKVNKDSVIKDALLNGSINATAADSLMDIEEEQERHNVYKAALEKAEEDFEEKVKKTNLAIKNTSRKIEIAKKKKEEAEEFGDVDEITDADALLEKHANTLEAKKREKNEISPKINTKNIEQALDEVGLDIESDEESDDESAPKATKKPKMSIKSIKDAWMKEIEASINRGHMTEEQESIPPILNNCFIDMIKAMFDEKISYQDFIYRWTDKMIDAGLDLNAGFIQPKSEPEDDDETGDL